MNFAKGSAVTFAAYEKVPNDSSFRQDFSGLNIHGHPCW